MTIVERLTKELKTKAASFGYNQKELSSLAEAIASTNATLADDATDEDVASAVESAIAPLRLGQQMSQRLLGESKKDEKRTDPEPTPPTPKTPADDMPAWAKTLMDDVRQLRTERTAITRLERLREVLGADAGIFGERTTRDFARMHFANEEDFTAYLDEVKSDLETLKQHEGEQSLAGLATPPAGKQTPSKKLSDEELASAF